jgi:hypothetical protein
LTGKLAREYWRQQKAACEPPDIARINELSGSREYHLEAVCLLNGLRYALIKDAEGNDAFDDHVFSNVIRGDFSYMSPRVIRNVPLGGGHILKTIFTSQANSQVVSYVEKKVSDASGGVHEFEYQIDPFSKDFDGRYFYRNNEVGESLWVDDKETPVLLVVGDRSTRNQVEFGFDRRGAITMIAAAGRYLLGAPNARPEVLPLTEESMKGVLSLEGSEIDSSLARSIFTDTFSLPIEGRPLSEVRLDIPVFVSNMIRNVNGNLSSKPHNFVQDALD